MPISVSHAAGSLKKFRRVAGQFDHQATFTTPPKNLPPFIAALFSAIGPIESGVVIISKIIFEPKNLDALLARYSLASLDDAQNTTDLTVLSAGENETQELLQAALADPVDFAFVPSPKVVHIYADHDDYVTFFTARKGNLSRIIEAFSAIGIMPNDYHRKL
ncbi:MAG TPA: hypothetical protein VMD30_13770 [Tepidisphaeraceae bacterium]|nr:hypothetical protein [Tepidisphaeraceae bacterium]